MTGRPKPKLVKSYELSRKKHELLCTALKLYAAEMEKRPHVRQGARKIVTKVMDDHTRKTGERIEISYSTVLRVYNGGQSLHDFNKSKALLNQQEGYRMKNAAF